MTAEVTGVNVFALLLDIMFLLLLLLGAPPRVDGRCDSEKACVEPERVAAGGDVVILGVLGGCRSRKGPMRRVRCGPVASAERGAK